MQPTKFLHVNGNENYIIGLETICTKEKEKEKEQENQDIDIQPSTYKLSEKYKSLSNHAVKNALDNYFKTK